MANKITYTDKEYLINDETIPDKNKVLDTDLNEIKEVVNNNADELDTATANIEELQGTVESQENAINGLQEDNTINKANIQENTTDITNIKTEQATQNTRISDLETDNATNTQNIATLQIDSGHTLELDLNNTTYVLTATLKNKAGTVLSTSTVDFPVEQLVLNVEYDSTTKELIKTLKNGQVTRVPLSSIINGLVSQTDFDDLENRVETNEGDINTLQTDLNSLEGRVETNEGSISTLQGKVSNIETEQTTQNEQIEDNTNNITDLQEKTQELTDQIPEGTEEGTFITLNDSSNLPFVSIEVGGDIEQETREGYNKFNVDDISSGFFSDDTGSISATTSGVYTNEYIDVGNNSNIYVLLEALQKVKVTRFFIQEYDENKVGLRRTIAIAGYEIEEGQKSESVKELLYNTKYVRFCVYNLQKYENDTYVSISAISEIKNYLNTCCSFSHHDDYEPYGAMPSPDYPSDVQVVTGNIEVEISNEDDTETQTQLLSLGENKLLKIENYRDCFKENNKWYLRKKIGKFVYDGEGSVSSPSTNYYNINNISGLGYIGDINTKTYLSNKYRAVEVCQTDSIFIANTQDLSFAFCFHPNGNTIRFKDTRGLSLSDFKTSLIGTVFYYALKNPTDIEITDQTLISQLNELKKLHTYKNITNINTNTEGLDPILKVTYKKDLETLFNKLDNLENRLALLEG